jgi:hypothetical protein
MQVVFFKYAGYTYNEGINQLLATATGITPATQSVPPTDLTPLNHMMHLREFIH